MFIHAPDWRKLILFILFVEKERDCTEELVL